RTLLRLSGMGGERAARAARALLEAGATSLVSWGVAGGLNPELPGGTLLLPRQIACDGRKDTLPTDERWRTRLHGRLQPELAINSDSMLSVAAPIEVAGKKHQLSRNGYAAVDMESYAIAE